MPTSNNGTADIEAAAPIVVAGASGRSFAQVAAAAGLSCHVFDFFGDRDTRKICHIGDDERVTVCKNYDFMVEQLRGFGDAVLIPVGGLELRTDLLETLPSEVCVAGSTVSTQKRLCDHRQLSRVLVALGCEPFFLPVDVARRSGDSNWIVKRLSQCGGSSVRRVSHANVPSLRFLPDEVLQRQFAGPAMSAIFVAAWHAGQCSVRRIGVTRQFIGVSEWGASEFAWSGCLSEPTFPARQAESIDDIANGIARSFGIVGAFGIDFVVEDDVCRPVDINPRLTASSEIVQSAFLTNENLIAIHLAACAGEFNPACERSHHIGPVFGKAILYNKASHPVLCSESIVDHFPLACDDPVERISIADIPMVGTVIQPGHPVLTLLVSGRDQMEATSRLHENAARIYGKHLTIPSPT